MSGVLCAMAGSGGGVPGGTLDTQTVTVGASGSLPDRVRGFSTLAGIGSIDDGTSNVFGGAAITELMWDENGSGGFESVVLNITGATNSGWTSMTIGGTDVFTRASASFSSGQWTWLGAGNPFGSSGTKIVAFD